MATPPKSFKNKKQILSLISSGVRTTKFLDYQMCTFNILLSWRFQKKTAFLDNSPFLPPRPTPLKSANFIFIVVSQSLTLKVAANFLELLPKGPHRTKNTTP